MHLIINPEVILGKARGSRRNILTEIELVPQESPVSPPAVEDQHNWAGSQLYPPPPPSLAPASVTGDSQPAVYNPLQNSQFRYEQKVFHVTDMIPDPRTMLQMLQVAISPPGRANRLLRRAHPTRKRQLLPLTSYLVVTTTAPSPMGHLDRSYQMRNSWPWSQSSQILPRQG
jgi:hypothetical protein